MEDSGRSRCCGEKDGMKSDVLLFLLCWWSFVVRADEGLSDDSSSMSCLAFIFRLFSFIICAVLGIHTIV